MLVIAGYICLAYILVGLAWSSVKFSTLYGIAAYTVDAFYKYGGDPDLVEEIEGGEIEERFASLGLLGWLFMPFWMVICVISVTHYMSVKR